MLDVIGSFLIISLYINTVYSFMVESRCCFFRTPLWTPDCLLFSLSLPNPKQISPPYFSLYIHYFGARARFLNAVSSAGLGLHRSKLYFKKQPENDGRKWERDDYSSEKRIPYTSDLFRADIISRLQEKKIQTQRLSLSCLQQEIVR